MTAKEYLAELKKIDVKIRQRKGQLERSRQRAESIAVNNDEERVQTSGSGDKIGNAVAVIVDIEKEIAEIIEELERKEQEIIRLIQRVEDLSYSELLYKRYVEFKSFEEIACEDGYTFRHTTRMHGRALIEFEKIYAENEKMSVNVRECP